MQGFPGDSDGKDSACNAGNPGKDSACNAGNPGKDSACNAGNPGWIPGLGRSPGVGNGNPLQYSCLEYPMDKGAWWAKIHGVAESDRS